MTAALSLIISRNRLTVFFLLAIAFWGGLSYQELPREGSPSIDIPLITVTVPFAGGSAGDIEAQILRPLEQ